MSMYLSYRLCLSIVKQTHFISLREGGRTRKSCESEVIHLSLTPMPALRDLLDIMSEASVFTKV